MTIGLKSYLCGEWVAGAGPGATLVNPTSEEPIATASTDGIDFGRSFSFAREKGGPGLRSMTFAQRGEMIEKLSKAIHASRDELIEASILNAGTPRSDAKFDIDGASGTLAFYAALGKKLGDKRFLAEGEGEQLTRSARFWGRHVRVPRHGVAVHINAFNFPAWGLAEKAAVALLAGMPVISKPATSTALTTFKMMEKLVASGALPVGALQLVCGAAGDLLDQLTGQDVLAFTGGGSTAEHLRSNRAVIANSVRMNVEADSLNASILGSDAQPGSDTYQMFIRDVVRESTQKTGQKCTATRRVFVPSAWIDDVQRELIEKMSAIVIGDPALEEVRMGPLATSQQLRDAREGVAKLVASGARVVMGSATEVTAVGRDGGKGYFFGPMLLRADEPRAAVAVDAHVVFAPVRSLMPYGTIDEATTLVSLGRGALVGSLYSDEAAVIESALLNLAPYHGRLLLGSAKVADQAISPGLVLPSCVHGGPGRAGGGEELGGERGLDFYTQRCAMQGDRAILERVLGS